jgi:hypothetical protein
MQRFDRYRDEDARSRYPDDPYWQQSRDIRNMGYPRAIRDNRGSDPAYEPASFRDYDRNYNEEYGRDFNYRFEGSDRWDRIGPQKWDEPRRDSRGNDFSNSRGNDFGYNGGFTDGYSDRERERRWTRNEPGRFEQFHEYRDQARIDERRERYADDQYMADNRFDRYERPSGPRYEERHNHPNNDWQGPGANYSRHPRRDW